MRDPDRDRIERRLRELRAPDESGAQERARRVVRAAALRRDPLPRRGRPTRLALAAVGALVVAVGLTPAGASVRDWIGDAVDGADGVPALNRLPAGGRVLVTSRSGTWIVERDGSRRRIGPFDEAGWSPNGLFAVATRGRQLIAVEPDGEARWAVSAPGPVSRPRWSPSGFRIAYRSGRQLRLVNGDGSGDRRLDRGMGAVAPSWRPPPDGVTAARHVLAYTDRRGRVRTLDADSGKVLWSTRPGLTPVAVEWLSNERLVVAEPQQIMILGPDGEVRTRLPQPTGATVAEIAISRAASRIVVVRTRQAAPTAATDELTGLGGPQSELSSIRIRSGVPRTRTLFAAPGLFSGLTVSPDGGWVLAGWREADQWLFLRPARERKLLRRVVAIGNISRQLDPGGAGRPDFPRIEGWCCPGATGG